MKRFFTAAAALLAASCSGGVPPIGVDGSGGFKVYTGEGTPVDVYQAAYGRMSNRHRFLDNALRLSPVDRGSVAASLDDIIRDLEIMASCVVPGQQAAFGPLLQEYRQWRGILAQGRSAGLLSAARDLEARVRGELSPSKFSIPERFPPGEDASRPPGASSWVAFVAWKSSHGDLVDAIKREKAAEAAAAWKHLRESLQLILSALDAERQTRVRVYADFYERLARDSREFTAFTAGLTREKALTELDVVAGLMTAVAPEKKD